MRAMVIATGLLLGMATVAVAQTAPAKTVPGGDAALTYQWVHSNTQPGNCGCFDMNGGGFSISSNVRPRLAVVGDISGEFASNGPNTGNSLTLISYMVGGRYYLATHGLKPFAQVLIGVAHAGGGIAGAGDASTNFASRMGVGVSLPMGEHFALRGAVDYFLTDAPNMSNNHQNNLLVGVGVAYRWDKVKK